MFQQKKWRSAYQTLPAKGLLRVHPEDFQVDELLEVDFTGRGEHLWLQVTKIGQNTSWVAKQLAEYYGVPSRQVGWSGLKDRHAVTTQWFSLPWPIKKELPAEPRIEGCTIQRVVQHNRKLNVGTHQKNKFTIVLRELEADSDALQERLLLLCQFGVPNYFGEQRFGREFGNLQKVAEWFSGGKPPKRDQQSILISAARSFLFNEYLELRLQEDSWLQVGDIEACMLVGSKSWFSAEGEDITVLQQRLEEGDISTSGPMWGKGDILAKEEFLLEKYEVLAKGLCETKLKQQRRSLLLPVEEMNWDLTKDSLRLSFVLEAGAFATSVLAEVIDYTDVQKVS